VSRNIAAFLAMLAHAEGTDQAPDPYRCCYGYAHTIADLRDHPAITGEWAGERLPARMCQAAGIKSGVCRSTAAGRYQIIRGTWAHIKRLHGLTDFSAASQDKAAVEIIRGTGALADVEAGRITEAILKCSKRWASLPGAGVGQPERKLSVLIAAYKAAGGMVAQ